MNFWSPLKRELEQHANTDIAQQQKDYMRGQFEYYGIKAPVFNKLFSEFLKEGKATSWEELKEQVLWLWDQPEREWQMIGLIYMRKLHKLWGDDLLSFTERLILEKSWWDTVDSLASNVVGGFLKGKQVFAEEEMIKWNQSDNLWKIRTSIIFQLKYKEQVNADFLAQAILNHQDSSEFFIRKAQGWALRQYSRFNPEWVKEFLDTYELSGLAKREGSKYL